MSEIVNGGILRLRFNLPQPGDSIIRAAPQTLAKGDKITLTVERIDGGKLRSTCASCYPIRRI